MTPAVDASDITADTTLYAKWTLTHYTYTVNYYAQKDFAFFRDSYGAPNFGGGTEREWEFLDTQVLSAPIGSEVSHSDLLGLIAIPTGYEAVNSTAAYSIESDGSTEINVYYKRKVYQVTIRSSASAPYTVFTVKMANRSYDYTTTGNRSEETVTCYYGYPVVVTLTGLAGTNEYYFNQSKIRYDYNLNAFDDVIVDRANNTYTFTMPSKDSVISFSKDEKDVKMIEIANGSRDTYVVGAELDKSNIRLNITYADNAVETYVNPDDSELTITNFDTSTVTTVPRTATVVLSGYKGAEENRTATFTYTVTQGYAYKVIHHFEDFESGSYDVYTDPEEETLYGTGTTQAVAKNYPGFTAPATIAQKTISEDGTTQIDIYYTRNSYTVTFEANGGEFPANAVTTLSAKCGVTVSVEGITAPAKTGFVFTGWNTSSEGTGMPVDKSGNYTVTAETNQTLYAVYEAKAVTRLTGKSDSKKEWYVGEAIGDYYFTAEYNDETTEDISVATTGVEVKYFDTSTATGTGETRRATIKYGGQQYSFNYTVVVRKYSITYDANGATGTPYYQSPRPEGQVITVGNANSLTKTGYTFTGWLYSGDNRVYQPGATLTMPAQNDTFTAQWKLNAPTLSCEQAVDNNGSNEVTLTYNGNDQSITVTAAHDLGNAVSYAYQWWTGTINLGDKGTNAWINVTNVSESYRYICVVTATYGTDKSSAIYPVTVTVNQAEQAELTFSQTAITYAGSDIDLSQYVSGGSGDGAITFSKVSSSNVTHGTFGTNGIIQNITKAGGTFTFKVKKAASSDGNYKAAEKEFTLTINKGVQNIVIGDISSPTFGSSYDLTASGNVGTVTFEIITGGTATGKIENGKLSISDRGADGTVTVKATAAETDLYAQGTATKTFTFAKASYDSAPEFSGNIPAQTYTLCVGRALSEITLSTYWSWQDGQSLPDQTGTYDRTAIFTPASPDNYEGTEATISITVAAHNTEGAATSNNNGTHYHTCSVCSEIITENCTFGDWVTTVQPGVNQEGSKYRDCSVCGYRDTQVIPATHTCEYDTEFTVDIAPTCTTAGEKSRHCTTAGCEHRTDITEIPALGHEWGEWTVKTAPTAQTTGELERICANDSSHTDSFVLPALNNSDYVYSVVTAPGCETAGEGKYSYTKDNKTFDFAVTLAATGHTLTHHAAKAATCTEDGNTEYWTCSVCGKYFSNGAGTTETTLIAVTLNASGHEWGGWTSNDNGSHTHVCTHDGSHTETADCTYEDSVVAPTCTTRGYTRHTCTVCGYHYDDTPTDETPHTLTAHAAVSPTHTTAGNIAYWTCSVCNKYFSDENGETEISQSDTVLQATGHSHSSEWKSDESGHWHECSCGDKADVSTHTPCAAATETTPQTCTTCGYVITPATGHVTHTPDTSKWYSDGTNHWHKCVGCEEKLDVAQHSGGTATCEHKAVCEICGAEYGELAAHSYGEWTHYNDTQHKRVCSVNADHVEYADHAWNDGVITTAPTHTATGVKTYTCADCGHTKTEIVPVTVEHVYNLEIAEARFLKSAATCTQRAVYYKSCACGERGTATFEYDSYAAHIFTAHPAVAATCTTAGNIAYWQCSVCNKYFSDANGETEITQAQTVIAAGHNYEFTRTVAPNLEAQTDGYDLWTCTRDESHTERRNIVEWETLIADKVTVTVSGGTIQGQSGSSITVNKNGNVTVVADEIEGKTFVGWQNANGDIVSENATYTFRASADMTLTAVYEDVTPEPNGLSGGAIAGIAVGGVAIAGFGGFAIFWFAVKKKSFADLLAAVKRKK